MSEQEALQLSNNAAVVYEQDFVPALFGQWPPQLADAAEIGSGDRVLDVGCGTGIFAREAAVRSGQTGKVTGLDVNESMLTVAKRLRPEIDWRLGDTTDLPFEDEAFDVVASQFVLMFVPDRIAALKEMWRVLAPGGRLVVAVWSASPGYAVLAKIARRRAGEEAAATFEAGFALGNQAEVLELFSKAGIPDARLKSCEGWARFPSIDEFVRVEIKGWVLADALDEATYEALLEGARERLAEFCDSDGRIAFPMDAHIITARKA
jgi:ubiquinone/menaquinone biosynthesis C-methylase UbiE